MTAPATVSLTMYQGQDFVDTLAFYNVDDSGAKTPVDLTGFDAHMQTRTDVTDLLPVTDWSTATGEMVIDGPNGLLTFAVPAALNVLIPTNNEFLSLVYDLILSTSAPIADRVIQGVINISPSVTRA